MIQTRIFELGILFKFFLPRHAPFLFNLRQNHFSQLRAQFGLTFRRFVCPQIFPVDIFIHTTPDSAASARILSTAFGITF